MSDPVTNVEIEDVLSSIRRLVSEEDRAVAEPVEAAPKHVQEAERFVLTPALRVADAPEEEVEAAPEGDTAESDAEEIAETLSVAEADPLPEVVEEENTQDAAVAEDAAPVEEDAESEVEADIEDEAEPVTSEPISSDAVNDRSDLEAKIAALEAAVGNVEDDEWEPDGSEASRGDESDWEEVEAAGFAPSPEPFDSHMDEPVPTVDDSVEDAQIVQEDEADDLAAFFAEESVIDEDMLREMVADIVREELQGSLGERITRNVRKLVRREIHRVLASQEFD